MTHTDPTAAALLRAILLHPDDDTARLVFADWLDEHAEPPRECPRASTYNPTGPACAACGGGYKNVPHNPIVGNGFAERAEFIRVQCELARLHAAGHGMGATVDCPVIAYARANQRAGGQMTPKCRKCDDAMELEYRERELLTDERRREWSGIKCPVCGGAKKVPAPWVPGHGGQAPVRCRHCDGTGLAPVEFRRGFVERVSCRMEGVLRREVVASVYEHPPEYDWRLTDWARGILAAHPVTRWEITDREPWDGYRRLYGWWCESSVSTGRSGITLPLVVLDELSDDPRRGDGTINLRHTKGANMGCVLFATQAEALEALALALGRVARRLAGLPEATP